MERSEVKFRARDQVLTFTGGIRRYASDTVNYVEACFELSDNWSGYDAVTAVWNNGTTRISTVLDSHGACCVPQEVLSKKGEVYVNLAGTTSAGGAVTERLTTYPVWVLAVDAKSHTRGAEQTEITPTQFEQFASAVRSDASDAREAASASAASSTASAQSASSSAQSASEAAGYSRSAMTAAEQAHTDASTAQGYRNDTEQHAQQASASASSASTSEQNAREYAQNADDSADAASMASTYASRMKDLAEQAKTSAESARDTILGMSATATTLEAGSEATASYSDGLLTIGVPRGAKGDKGDTGLKGDKGDQGIQGIQGETGATPNLTIGTVETLEPTEDATASITGTAENPVLNLGLPKGDTGEVSLEDLGALLPTDTASGDIASITDGQNVVPVKSLKVTLEPIQDLHGYDKPWSEGAGVNKFGDYTVINSYMNSSGVLQPTSPSDRTYIIKALPSTQYAYKFVRIPKAGASVNDDYQIGEYYGDNHPEVGDVGTRIEAAGYVNNIGTGTFTTSASAKWIAIKLANIERTDSEATASTAQVEIGSSVSTSWTPYSNICPISGHTECVTSVSGVNLFDKDTAVNGYIDNNSGVVKGTAPYKSSDFIRVAPNEPIYVKTEQTSADWGAWYDINKVYISGVRNYGNAVITPPSNAYYVRLTLATSSTGNIDTVSINYPSTDHDYHAYNGNTYTTTLGRTVYGGTLDVVSGVLTVDRGYLSLNTADMNNSEDWPGWSASGVRELIGGGRNSTLSNVVTNVSPLSSAAVAANTIGVGDILLLMKSFFNKTQTEWKALAMDIQFVIPLAEPQTYQLTPTEIALLEGTNNVWSDGNVTIVYNADIQKWVEKKLNANSTTSMLTMSRPMVQTETTETEETETETAETE